MKNNRHRHPHNLFAWMSGLALAFASPLQAATVNQVAKFSNTGGQVTDSSISDSGGNVNVAANLLLGGTTNYLGLKRSSDGATRAVVFNGAVLGGADTDFLEFGALPNGFKFLDTSNNPLLTILNNGNVGFGVTTPNRRLMVVSSGTTEAIRAEAPTGVNAFSIGTGILSVDAPGVQNGRFIVNDSGNVGIGVANPNRKLMVFTSDATEGIRVDVPSGVNALAIGTGTLSVDAPGVQGGRFFVMDSGAVGIGAPAPQGWLHVKRATSGVNQRWEWAGTANNINVIDFTMSYNNGVLPPNPNGAYLSYINSAADFGIRTKPLGGANFIIGSTGHVGIDTIFGSPLSPASPLEIDVSSATAYDATALDSETQIILANTSNAANNTAGISFNVGAGAGNQAAFMESVLNHTNASAAIAFGTRNTSGVLAERVRLTADGNLGVGNPAPASKLDVTGAIHATGTITSEAGITAVYQDVAEWVPAGENLSPGTVVVLNPEKKNEVIASSEAYDTTVAGVVSEHPGIVLGKSGADKAQVATTGRVKVRVDARRAAIKIGDLLVTSDVAGTAMKSEPMEINGRRFHQPGTIVGKALEPLDRGTGEILVLLSLQ